MVYHFGRRYGADTRAGLKVIATREAAQETRRKLVPGPRSVDDGRDRLSIDRMHLVTRDHDGPLFGPS